MANNVVKKGNKLWIETEEGHRISAIYGNFINNYIIRKQTENILYIVKKRQNYKKHYIININTGKVVFEKYLDRPDLSYFNDIIVNDYTYTIINVECTRIGKFRTNYEIYDYNGNLLYKYSRNGCYHFGSNIVFDNSNLLKVFTCEDKNIYDLLYKDKIIKKNVCNTLVLPDKGKIIVTNDKSISMYDINTIECLKERKFKHNSREYKYNRVRCNDNIIIVSFYDINDEKLQYSEVLYADTLENVLDLNVPFYKANFELWDSHLFLNSYYIDNIINITLYDSYENILGKKIYNYKLKKYISDDIYEEIYMISSKYILLKKGGIATIYTTDGKYVFGGKYTRIKLLKLEEKFIVYNDEKHTLPGIISQNGNVVIEPIDLYKITEFMDIRILA